MNGSLSTIKEEITAQLVGLEIMGRVVGDGNVVKIEIKAGKDDLIILRRTRNDCSFGMTSKLFI